MNHLQNIISNKNQCKGTALSDKKKNPSGLQVDRKL